MNANTLNCLNKLIMQSVFLLKPFSNYHQTSIDMNTKYQLYQVNKFRTLSSFLVLFFPNLIYLSFPLYLSSHHSSSEKVTSNTKNNGTFPDSILCFLRKFLHCWRRPRLRLGIQGVFPPSYRENLFILY